MRTRTGVTRAAYLAEYANVLNAMKVLRRTPGVQVVRPDELFFDARRCSVIVDGRPMFADNGHLTAASARRVAPLFARVLNISAGQ